MSLVTSKKKILQAAKLYVVLDDSVAGFEKLFSVFKKIVVAGPMIVQLRSKSGSARGIVSFCKKVVAYAGGEFLFIVNDRVDLALAGSADGVHLGQEDLPLSQARKILGPQKIIGVSCQTISQARWAQKDGADYIGFGSVFKTKTKPHRRPMDIKLISRVSAQIKIPVFFIGGITAENISQVVEHGGRRVAVTRAVCQAKDARLATQALLRNLSFGDGILRG